MPGSYYFLQNCPTIGRVRMFFPSFDLPTTPLITLSSSSQCIIFLRFKREMSPPFSELVEGFFRYSGQQPALVSAQKIHTTKNKLVSVSSSAAGGNQADGNEAKSSLHPQNTLKQYRKGPTAPSGQVCCVSMCVYTCACVCTQCLQTIHRESRSESLCRRNTQFNLPCALYMEVRMVVLSGS